MPACLCGMMRKCILELPRNCCLRFFDPLFWFRDERTLCRKPKKIRPMFSPCSSWIASSTSCWQQAVRPRHVFFPFIPFIFFRFDAEDGEPQFASFDENVGHAVWNSLAFASSVCCWNRLQFVLSLVEVVETALRIGE